MGNISELIRVCNDLDISFNMINGDEANQIISQVIKFFNPEQTTGHLSISNDSNKALKIPLRAMSLHIQKITQMQGLYFFDLESKDRNNIFIFNNVQDICDVMSESFGMEYFLS